MRFVSLNDRNYKSIIEEFPINYVQNINQTKKNKLTWKGLTLMKDPMTLSIYQQVLQDLKPKTIIEFGSYTGGSALWMSDLSDCLQLGCKVYTFDINAIFIEKKNITTITLDNYNFKDYIKNNLELFKSLEHPVLVVEDSHENICEILTEIDKFLVEGDYIIVEDTIDKSFYNEMLKFLEKTNYSVDTNYCDFWGMNNSWNFNSYLIKN